MFNTQEAPTGRKLRLLGDGKHGERAVTTRSSVYDVEISPLDMAHGYAQDYVAGVYHDSPEAAVDTTSFDATPACPCAVVV